MRGKKAENSGRFFLSFGHSLAVFCTVLRGTMDAHDPYRHDVSAEFVLGGSHFPHLLRGSDVAASNLQVLQLSTALYRLIIRRG